MTSNSGQPCQVLVGCKQDITGIRNPTGNPGTQDGNETKNPTGNPTGTSPQATVGKANQNFVQFWCEVEQTGPTRLS